jgi:hypothetical protein
MAFVLKCLQEKRESGKGSVVFREILHFMGDAEKLLALKDSMQDLLIHLIKVGWREVKKIK